MIDGLAAWLGPVSEALERPTSKGLQVLWLTPLRALAVDSMESLTAAPPINYFPTILPTQVHLITSIPPPLRRMAAGSSKSDKPNGWRFMA